MRANLRPVHVLLLLTAFSQLLTVWCQTCTDQVKNGKETDVDCGGGTCSPCLTARVCLVNTDCLSAKCVSGKCQEPPECYNKVKDRRETDIDCGGGECYAGCYLGKTCKGTWDCRSRICSAGLCVQATSCTNLVQDGVETDWNCGGGACAPCGGSMKCGKNEDCSSKVCTNGRCALPATCSNGVLDAGEGAADCGGPCNLCGTGRTCNNAGDCLSNTCTSGKCAEAPHCFNKIKDGRETDVDCGGGACNAACGLGKRCTGRWDCLSKVCTNGICVAPPSPSPSPKVATPTPAPAPSPSPKPPVSSPTPPKPTCTDKILNNGETAIDCGGPNCPPCAAGQTCFDDGDCGSGYCIFP